MYSQTKQDIKNLRYAFVVTHVRGNHGNFQRFWPIDKGAEFLEIAVTDRIRSFNNGTFPCVSVVIITLNNYQTFANFVEIFYAYKT